MRPKLLFGFVLRIYLSVSVVLLSWSALGEEGRTNPVPPEIRWYILNVLNKVISNRAPFSDLKADSKLKLILKSGVKEGTPPKLTVYGEYELVFTDSDSLPTSPPEVELVAVKIKDRVVGAPRAKLHIPMRHIAKFLSRDSGTSPSSEEVNAINTLRDMLRAALIADPFLHPHQSPPALNFRFVPSDFQQQVIENMMKLKEIADSRNEALWLINLLPPGTGKTSITAAALSRMRTELNDRGIRHKPVVVYSLQSREVLEGNGAALASRLGIDTKEVLSLFGSGASDLKATIGSKPLTLISRTRLKRQIEELVAFLSKPNRGPLYLVLDEAHHLGKAEGEYESILNKIQSLLRKEDVVVGLSATPWHTDTDIVARFFKNNIVFAFLSEEEIQHYHGTRAYVDAARVAMFRAMAAGFLAPIYSYHESYTFTDTAGNVHSTEELIRDLRFLKLSEDEVTEESRQLVKNEISRHDPLLKQILDFILSSVRNGPFSEAPGRTMERVLYYNRGVIFVPTIAHAEAYADRLNELARSRAFNGEFRTLHSKQHDTTRAQNVDWLKDEEKETTAAPGLLTKRKSEKHKYLIAVRAIGEGWDSPNINQVIFARTFSDEDGVGLRELLQMIGRAVRPFGGKPAFDILTFTDDLRRLIFEKTDPVLLRRAIVGDEMDRSREETDQLSMGRVRRPRFRLTGVDSDAFVLHSKEVLVTAAISDLVAPRSSKAGEGAEMDRGVSPGSDFATRDFSTGDFGGIGGLLHRFGDDLRKRLWGDTSSPTIKARDFTEPLPLDYYFNLGSTFYAQSDLIGRFDQEGESLKAVYESAERAQRRDSRWLDNFTDFLEEIKADGNNTKIIPRDFFARPRKEIIEEFSPFLASIMLGAIHGNGPLIEWVEKFMTQDFWNQVLELHLGLQPEDSRPADISLLSKLKEGHWQEFKDRKLSNLARLAAIHPNTWYLHAASESETRAGSTPEKIKAILSLIILSGVDHPLTADELQSLRKPDTQTQRRSGVNLRENRLIGPMTLDEVRVLPVYELIPFRRLLSAPQEDLLSVRQDHYEDLATAQVKERSKRVKPPTFEELQYLRLDRFGWRHVDEKFQKGYPAVEWFLLPYRSLLRFYGLSETGFSREDHPDLSPLSMLLLPLDEWPFVFSVCGNGFTPRYACIESLAEKERGEKGSVLTQFRTLADFAIKYYTQEFWDGIEGDSFHANAKFLASKLKIKIRNESGSELFYNNLFRKLFMIGLLKPLSKDEVTTLKEAMDSAEVVQGKKNFNPLNVEFESRIESEIARLLSPIKDLGNLSREQKAEANRLGIYYPIDFVRLYFNERQIPSLNAEQQLENLKAQNKIFATLADFLSTMGIKALLSPYEMGKIEQLAKERGRAHGAIPVEWATTVDGDWATTVGERLCADMVLGRKGSTNPAAE